MNNKVICAMKRSQRFFFLSISLKRICVNVTKIHVHHRFCLIFIWPLTDTEIQDMPNANVYSHFKWAYFFLSFNEVILRYANLYRCVCVCVCCLCMCVSAVRWAQLGPIVWCKWRKRVNPYEMHFIQCTNILFIFQQNSERHNEIIIIRVFFSPFSLRTNVCVCGWHSKRESGKKCIKLLPPLKNDIWTN